MFTTIDLEHVEDREMLVELWGKKLIGVVAHMYGEPLDRVCYANGLDFGSYVGSSEAFKIVDEKDEKLEMNCFSFYFHFPKSALGKGNHHLNHYNMSLSTFNKMDK